LVADDEVVVVVGFEVVAAEVAAVVAVAAVVLAVLVAAAAAVVAVVLAGAAAEVAAVAGDVPIPVTLLYFEVSVLMLPDMRAVRFP